MTESVSKLPRRLIIILLSAVLLALAVHFAGVALVRYYTEEILHPALPRGTQIGEVHLNLFTGALEIRDFELRNEGLEWLRAGQLEIKISPWRLLGGDIHVQRARLSNAFLRVDRRQDGSYDLGVPSFGDQEPAPADAKPAPFSIAGAVLEAITVEYHDGEFKSVAQVDKIETGAYSARKKTQEIPVSWQLSLDERDISGQARLTLDQGQFGAEGELKTALLDLARVQRLAALDPVVEGEAAYEGDFSWQEPQLALTGALQAPSLIVKLGDRVSSFSGGDFPEIDFKLFTAPELSVELTTGKGSRAARVEWTAADQRAEADSLRFSGKFRYEDNKLVNVDKLQFQASGFGWKDGSQRVKFSDVAISGVLHQGIAGELVLPSADLQLSAGRLEFEDTQEALTMALDGLDLKGLKLRTVKDAKGSRQIEGQLNTATGRVGQADSVLQWSALTAGLGGTVGLIEVAVLSDLTINEMKLENPALTKGPLQIAKVTAEGLALSTESRFERLQLQGIQLPGDLPESGVKVGMLSFSGGSFAAAKGVDLGHIVIDGLQTAVIRDKTGQWRHPGTAIQTEPPESEPVEAAHEAPADTQALAWRMGSLKVTGDSYVITGDRTNPDAEPLRQKIDVLAFGEIASSTPEKDTPFEIALHPEKYTSFNIKGVVRPLADPLHLDAKGELAGLGMPRLNGFIANDLGYRFLSGQLDNRFDVKIADNTLKMGNALELHKAEAEALEGKDGPPLTLAIALLEDRDGYVKIDVPIEGRLDDPNFRVLAALNPVIMKAVAGSAALAIQPLGSVLLVGGMVADRALKVTFNPVLFAAGSTALDPDAEKYLGELSGKLEQKPKLAVRLCGVVAHADRKKDKKGAYLDKEEDLLEMAQERADAVRAFMNSKGAGKQQLRSCRPKVDAKPDAKPRVDIRL
jgi:outer membrane protein OmpA-like peptidoglycan-associated protein